MDERQELNAGRAAVIVLMLLVLGAIGVLAWEYVTTKDVANTTAVVVLLGAAGTFALFQRMFGAEAPRGLWGVELPTGADAASKAERRRWYLLDSAVRSGLWTAATIGAIWFGDLGAGWLPFGTGAAGLVVAAVLEFVVGFAIFYAITWASGEQQSRAVERKLAALG